MCGFSAPKYLLAPIYELTFTINQLLQPIFVFTRSITASQSSPKRPMRDAVITAVGVTTVHQWLLQ